MTDAAKTAAAKKAAAVKRKAATAEVQDGPPIIRVHGLELTLPEELPFAMMRHVADLEAGKASAAFLLVTEILGQEQMDALWGAGLTLQQGSEVVSAIMEAVGLTVGESAASASS